LSSNSSADEEINEYTNAHDTAKNGRFINYNIFLYYVSKNIFVLFLTNNLDYITQMENEIIKSFYS